VDGDAIVTVPSAHDDRAAGNLKERLRHQQDDRDDTRGDQHDGQRPPGRFFKEGSDGQLVEIGPDEVGGRLKKRIGKAVARQRSAELERDSFASENARLRSQLAASNANADALYEDSLKGDIDAGKAEIANLQSMLEVAHTEGDTKKVSELTVKISGATAKLAANQVEFERMERQKKTRTGDDKPNGHDAPNGDGRRAAPKLNPHAQAWIDANPWFMQSQTKHATAVSINNLMREGGWDPTDPEFYPELNKRLAAVGIKADAGDGNRQDDDDDDEPGTRRLSRPNGHDDDGQGYLYRDPAEGDPNEGLAAPAHRGTPGRRPAGPRDVHLTATERAFCRASGIDEREHALGKMLKTGQITKAEADQRLARIRKGE
jgi:hypothetical protein